MPGLLRQRTPEQKMAYLQRLWNKTYLDDVVERHKVKNRDALSSLVDALCSSVGSLTNPNRISRVLRNLQNSKIDPETIASYISYLEEAFLFEGAKRYNIKGNKYFESIKKYYSVDVGLRNAKLNFRQQEITHIMENVIYNELRMRGFAVDVGVVEAREMRNGKSEYIQYEIDFIASNGRDKYYIQSAFSLDSEEKRQQELRSLLKVDDSFQKIVITGSDIAAYTDVKGIADVENAGVWTGYFGVNYNIDTTKFIGAYVGATMDHWKGDADKLVAVPEKGWGFKDGFGFGMKFGIDF